MKNSKRKIFNFDLNKNNHDKNIEASDVSNSKIIDEENLIIEDNNQIKNKDFSSNFPYSKNNFKTLDSCESNKYKNCNKKNNYNLTSKNKIGYINSNSSDLENIKTTQNSESTKVNEHLNINIKIDEVNIDKKEVCTNNIKIPKSFGNNKKIFKNLNLGIDTEAINEKYLFGGDKQQSNISEDQKQNNFNEKIKLLAEHCVNYMNFKDNDENCEFFLSDVLFRDKDLDLNEFKYELEKKKKKEKLEDENIKEDFNSKKYFFSNDSSKPSIPHPDQPKSVKGGNLKICFNKKIEESFPIDEEIPNKNIISQKNEFEENDFNINLVLPKDKKKFQKNKKMNRKYFMIFFY